MYEEYDEYFDTPGVVDGIVDAAMMQIHDHLEAKVKEYLADAIAAEQKKDVLDEEIRRNELRLEQINEQIQKGREQVIDIEQREMPKRYIDAFIRNEIGDYVPGDIVWTIKRNIKMEKCPECNGYKRVDVLYNGRQIDMPCPKCKGYGQLQSEERFVKQHRIKEIRLILCFDKSSRVGRWSKRSIVLDGEGFDNEYRKESIYATKEDAEARIRELEQEGKQ